MSCVLLLGSIDARFEVTEKGRTLPLGLVAAFCDKTFVTPLQRYTVITISIWCVLFELISVQKLKPPLGIAVSLD